MLICENFIVFVCLLVEPCSYFTLVVIYLFHGSSKITLTTCTVVNLYYITGIIIHQTHYEKSDWSRAFNQFTIACELDMINVISAADIVFIMSNSTSAWLPSLLECSPQKQNG